MSKFTREDLGVDKDWTYDNNSTWSPSNDRIYNFFAKHYNNEQVVLEIGCLHGQSFKRAIKTIPHNNIKKAFLIDINKKVIDNINAKLKINNPYGFKIKAYVNNGINLEMISTGTVDYVFSFHVFKGSSCSFNTVVPAYLPEIKRVLRAKGKYLINTWYKNMPYQEVYAYEPFNSPMRNEVFFGYRENL
mgnify:CR=1 FL=1